MNYATYTSTFGTKTTYNYVKAHTRKPVAAGYALDFGVVDAKGRKVGMVVWQASLHEITLQEETPAGGFSSRGNEILEVGKPLAYFEITAIGARDGKAYGSATICVRSPSLGAAQVELGERIERARKAAVKKWTKA